MIITGKKVIEFSSILIVILMTVVTILMYVGLLNRIDNYLLFYLLTLVGCGVWFLE